MNLVPTIFSLMVSTIKLKQIGDKITRSELKHAINYGLIHWSESTMDNYRNYLTTCGYLAKVPNKVGVYQKVKELPSTMTSSSLANDYKEQIIFNRFKNKEEQ